MFFDKDQLKFPISLDDLLIVVALIDSLLKEADRDITAFDYDINSRYLNQESGDDEEKWEYSEKINKDTFVVKEITIWFDPSSIKNHPLVDKGTTTLKYTPALGNLNIAVSSGRYHRGGDGDRSYELWKEDEKLNKIKTDIKLKYISLYKKIKLFRDQTVPIKKRQEFLDQLSIQFPSTLIEAAFLREQYEEKDDQSGNARGISGQGRESNDSSDT